MKKVYSYKGEINKDLISVDTANIKVFEYIQSIDSSVLSDKEQELLSRLTISIAMNDANDSTTFSDVRFSYLFINMMLKNKSRIKVSTIVDFIVYYQYLTAFYNKEIDGIDEMIRFVNLFIGYTFQREKVSKAEIKELDSLANDLMIYLDNGYKIREYTPDFIYEAVDMALGITEAEWKEEVSKEDIVVETKPKVKEVVVEEEKTDDAEVAIWKEAIVALQEEIALGGEPEEIAVFQEAIQALKEEIEIATGKSFNLEEMMELGGVAQKFSSPLLLQFEQGGMVHRFSSPLPQTPKFGGEPTMLKNGGKIGFNALAKKVAAAYKGKKVKPKYQKEYGKTYSATEAKEVGNKVAAKVYRAQQNK
jgi:hypothetical protein